MGSGGLVSSTGKTGMDWGSRSALKLWCPTGLYCGRDLTGVGVSGTAAGTGARRLCHWAAPAHGGAGGRAGPAAAAGPAAPAVAAGSAASVAACWDGERGAVSRRVPGLATRATVALPAPGPTSHRGLGTAAAPPAPHRPPPGLRAPPFRRPLLPLSPGQSRGPVVSGWGAPHQDPHAPTLTRHVAAISALSGCAGMLASPSGHHGRLREEEEV